MDRETKYPFHGIVSQYFDLDMYQTLVDIHYHLHNECLLYILFTNLVKILILICTEEVDHIMVAIQDQKHLYFICQNNP